MVQGEPAKNRFARRKSHAQAEGYIQKKRAQ
jgi:hypothetical protein